MANMNVNASGISLFHLAAQRFGNACLWWRFLEANQLADYDLSQFEQQFPLKIPSTSAMPVTGMPSEVDTV